MSPHDPTPQQVLDCPLPHNDSGAATVRGYLIALLAELWRQEADFSGKRPFGNSGWQLDFAKPFIEAGWVSGTIVDGYVDDIDDDTVDDLVRGAIAALAEGHDQEAGT